jgi:hypothetical protein
MTTVAPTQNFVTYVKGQAVSATPDTPVELPDDIARQLVDAGMAQSVADASKAKADLGDAYQATAAVDATVAERRRRTTDSTSGKLVTGPPAELDEKSVQGDRAADIIKATTEGTTFTDGPAYIPADVDVNVVKGDRAADIIKETTKDVRTNPGADDAATYSRPAEVDTNTIEGDRAAQVIKDTARTEPDDDDQPDGADAEAKPKPTGKPKGRQAKPAKAGANPVAKPKPGPKDTPNTRPELPGDGPDQTAEASGVGIGATLAENTENTIEEQTENTLSEQTPAEHQAPGATDTPDAQ